MSRSSFFAAPLVDGVSVSKTISASSLELMRLIAYRYLSECHELRICGDEQVMAFHRAEYDRVVVLLEELR